MLLQDVIYFTRVAQLGSLSAAADEEFRTYQGIHKGIARLESELDGGPLITGRGKQLKLTEFGEYVYKNIAIPLLTYWNELNGAKDSYSSWREMTLIVYSYFLETNVGKFAERICGEFQEQNPDISVVVKHGKYPEAAEDIFDDKADIGICSVMELNDSLDMIYKLPQEMSQLCAIVSKKHRMGNNRSISLSNLYGETIALRNVDSTLSRYLIGNPQIDPASLVIINGRNFLLEELLMEGKIVRISVQGNAKNEMRMYKDCVCLPFDPPIWLETGFVIKKRPIRKQALERFIKFLEARP